MENLIMIDLPNVNKFEPEKINMITSEWDFLCYCCRMAIQGDVPSMGASYSALRINWEQLFLMASRNKVRTLLYKGLLKWEHKAQVPSGFLQKLRNVNLEIVQNNLTQAKELLALNQLFTRQNIQALPFKGIILSLEAFGDINAREFTDLDLFVYQRDFKQIEKLLLNRNYQPEVDVPYDFYSKFNFQYYEYNFDFFAAGKRLFHVEPHWFLGPKRFQIAFSLTDFESFIIEKKYLGQTFKTLNPEGLILSTVIHHGGQDAWRSLKQIADLAALITKYKANLNWELLLETAAKWKVSNLLILGLKISQSFFDTTIPKLLKPKLNNKQLQYYANQKIEELISMSIGQSSNKNVILENIKYHLSIRQESNTKLKVVYYHFLQALLPTILDVQGKPINNWNLMLLMIKKPFRLWKAYIGVGNK